MLGAAGLGYQAIATEQDQRAYPPPGQLVDVGGTRLHINCTGQGSPTVILESGYRNDADIWSTPVSHPPAVLPGVAAFTRPGLCL